MARILKYRGGGMAPNSAASRLAKMMQSYRNGGYVYAQGSDEVQYDEVSSIYDDLFRAMTEDPAFEHIASPYATGESFDEEGQQMAPTFASKRAEDYYGDLDKRLKEAGFKEGSEEYNQAYDQIERGIRAEFFNQTRKDLPRALKEYQKVVAANKEAGRQDPETVLFRRQKSAIPSSLALAAEYGLDDSMLTDWFDSPYKTDSRMLEAGDPQARFMFGYQPEPLIETPRPGSMDPITSRRPASMIPQKAPIVPVSQRSIMRR